MRRWNAHSAAHMLSTCECRYGDETEVCWNDAAKQQEESVYKRSFWTGERAAAVVNMRVAVQLLLLACTRLRAVGWGWGGERVQALFPEGWGAFHRSVASLLCCPECMEQHR